MTAIARSSVYVDIARQRLDLLADGVAVRSYVISSAAAGIGFEAGSGRTPVGLFRIARKIGGGEPEGAIFVSRRPVGHWPDNPPPGTTPGSDLILTRILWLDGMEDRNQNTMDRYIYIHGTNCEDKLGCPCSCGCIRMGSSDVAELFELVEVDTPVEIVP